MTNSKQILTFKLNSSSKQLDLSRAETNIIDFGTQSYRTGEFMVQSQDGVDKYYKVNFEHIKDSTDIKITYCLDNNLLKQAQIEYKDYKIPDKITVKTDITGLSKSTESLSVSSKVIDKANNYCIELIKNPYSVDMIELGENSTIIIPQSSVFEPGVLLTNVTLEANFTHLTIDTSQVPYNSLVAYYPMDVNNGSDGKTYDYSANNNDATVIGGSNISWTPNGKYGGAFNFSGNNGRINTTLYINNNSLTVCCWSKFFVTNVNDILVSNYNGTSGGFWLNKNVNNYLAFNIYNSTPSQVVVTASSFGIVSLNTWYHHCGVINLTTISIYVNGVYYNSTSSSNTNQSSKYTISIGSHPLSTSSHNGSIDEVMIFNTSLNSSQILDIYNNQSGRFMNPGTQTILQQSIQSGYNQVNITLDGYARPQNTNLSIRLGAWDLSLGYNNTDLISPSGLIAYYHFDNSTGENDTYVRDWVSGLNNGTVIGGNNISWSSSCIYGGCYNFSGNVNYINITTPNGLNYKSNFTVTFWFKESFNNTRSELISDSVDPSNKVFNIYTQGNGYFSCEYYNATVLALSTASTDKVALNKWYFGTCVYNMNNINISIYFNGRFSNSATNSSLGIGGTGTKRNIFISSLRGGSNFFNGSIDEVMIFNRSLTNQEIKQLYVMGRANWNYTNYQNLSEYNSVTPSSANLFNISTSTTNLLLDFNFLSDFYNFYSPSLATTLGINLTTSDTIFPLINFTNPSESSGEILERNNILINVTSTDINLNNITINVYNSIGTLLTSTNSTTSPIYLNYSGLSDGTYFFNATSCDTSNNCNSTETRNVTIDLTDPAIQFVSPTQSSGVILKRDYIEINTTAVLNFIGLDTINISLYNSTNNLINNSASLTSPFYVNYSGLAGGVYYYNATRYSLLNGNVNLATRTITLDTIPPYFITIPNNISVSYPSNISVQFNATDLWSNPVSYSVNDSKFNIDNNGNLTNLVTLSGGVYILNISVNDSLNNINYTLFQINITKNNTHVLSITGTTPITYPTVTDVAGSGCLTGLICSLNPSNTIYGVGIVTFNYSTDGNENYSANSITKDIVINQGSPSLSLTSSNGWNIQASIYDTITGTCISQLTCNLYQAGTSISNPFTNIFPAGNYQFIFNTTGNTNYTSASISNNLVSQLNGTLGINGTIPTNNLPTPIQQCLYKKLGYYNIKLPWIHETNCI